MSVPDPAGLPAGPGLIAAIAVLGGLGYGVSRLVRRGRGKEATSAQPTVLKPAATKPAAAEPTVQPQLGWRPREDVAAAAVTPRASAARVSAAFAAADRTGEWAVETHGLTKRFGANVAVDQVELLVPRGCAFGYLGPNCAGKTTLIRTLLGLTRADAGSMSLLGLPVPAERRLALARVGAIVDEPRFHPNLTGRENLRLLAAARGQDAGPRIDPSLARVGLAERADHKVGVYSMGMRQRLGVAACLLGDPELLILDEPMNGLDPAGMHEMRAMIASLVDEGRTVMLSSHLLDEVERTCDVVAIVDHGRVVRQGPIDDLVRSAGTSVVEVDCDDAARALRLVQEAGIAAATALSEAGIAVTLRPGAERSAVAEVNKRLVGAGIPVYRLQETRASLEDWFLSVTSRLGDKQ